MKKMSKTKETDKFSSLVSFLVPQEVRFQNIRLRIHNKRYKAMIILVAR